MMECCGQCLEWFVQLNWTGPPVEEIQTALESVVGQERLKLLNQDALASLSVDGEVRLLTSIHANWTSCLFLIRDLPDIGARPITLTLLLCKECIVKLVLP